MICRPYSKGHPTGSARHQGKALTVAMLFSTVPTLATADTLWTLNPSDPGFGFPILVITLVTTIVFLLVHRMNEKRVMGELLHRRNQIEVALDSATMGLWEWNISTGEFTADDCCIQMLGYEPDEVEPHFTWWSEQTHPDDRKRAKSSLLTLFAGQSPTYSAEYRIRAKSGEWLWILDRAKVVSWGHNGTPLKAVGTHVDVSAHHAAQTQLQRLATVVEQAAETIIITNSENLIEYVNPTFVAKLGYTLDEVSGQTPKLFRSGRHNEVFYQSMRNDLKRGRVWHGTLVNRCKDGTSIELETTISPVKDEHGTTTHYVAIGRDVTHESLLESQLRQAQKMEALGTLAGGIAHDFNNILSAVIGYTELAMQDSDEESPAHANMVEVFKAAKRAADLVAQILTFSRRTEKERRPLLLAPIMKEALKLLRGTLPSTIDIQQTISADCPPVLADATQMHQVIMNLCTNAYHAMREQGGVLDVRLELTEFQQEKEAGQLIIPPGKYARMSISDTGHGMTPEIRDRIFEPYFTTKRGRDGTGLGLATVHGIAKLHDGAVTVYSEPGEGTTFNVFLPICTPDIEERGSGKPAEPLPRGNGELILVVDDEEAIVQMVEIALRHLGYDIEAYESSVKALEAFELNPDRYDCVITDQTMPTLTGADLARRLLQQRPDLPIVLCSGFSEAINDEKARELGIREYIMKPMTTRVLADAVHRLLN
jgi:PAS domain S-box-containing protein